MTRDQWRHMEDCRCPWCRRQRIAGRPRKHTICPRGGGSVPYCLIEYGGKCVCTADDIERANRPSFLGFTRHAAIPFLDLPVPKNISGRDLALRSLLAGLALGTPVALSGYVIVRVLRWLTQ